MMSANRVMTAVLFLIALLIPLMWILGHRGNNSLLFFMVVFALFKILSRSFSDKIDAVIASMAESFPRRTRIFASFVIVEVALVILHVINNTRYHFWNLDREEGVATLVAAALLALNVLVISACRKRSPRKSDRWKWLLVGILFALIAIDELSEMHGWFALQLYHLAGGEGDTFSGGFVVWVIVMSPLIIAIVISLIWFFFRVLGRSSQMWALGALFCWCLVLTVEVLGGRNLLPWLYSVAFEEFLEMLGSTLFLYAFLTQLRQSLTLTAGE